LFVIAAAAVLANVVGAICVETDLFDSSDQLVVVSLLSVPLILILLVTGAILGLLEVRAARKASRDLCRMTVVATSLHVVSLTIGGLAVAAALFWFVALMSGLSPL
jgi:hypothetical protein